MAIEFKSLKMMALRAQPGEILDRVSRDGEAFLIERNGHPKACLVPVSYLTPDIPPKKISEELDTLQQKGECPRINITDNHEVQFSFVEEINNERVLIKIILGHGYPNTTPKVYADPISRDSPHRWKDGSLCIFGTMAQWNPGTHDIYFVLNLARQWLKKYQSWQSVGKWPNKMEINNEG
jgi:prevent-host-death family protein